MSQKRSRDSYEVSRRVQRAFGARLKSARQGKDALQKILASQLGLSRTSISNIERGTHRVFLDQVYSAAHALGIEVFELLPPAIEIYGNSEVHSAVDDPLSETAAESARQVALSIQQDFSKLNPRRRRPESGRRQQ